MRGTRRYNDFSKRRHARAVSIPHFTSFESIKLISPAVALALAAEYERVWRLGGNKPFVANIHKWDELVVDVLWEIGFFEIVGFPQDVPEPSPKGDEVIVRMQSGETVDPELVKNLIGKLRDLYPGSREEESEAGLVHIYGAMIEAIVNVVQHAYPKGINPWGATSRRWWMTGAVNRKTRWTTAVVYDQGVTIPVSLPNWRRYAGWRDRISASLGFAPVASNSQEDGRVIEVAVQELATSTEEEHHGHGLAQMQGFVDHCVDGHLRILSRCGEVVFRPGHTPEVKTHSVPIWELSSNGGC